MSKDTESRTERNVLQFVTTKLVREREMFTIGPISMPEYAASLINELIGDSDHEQVYVICVTAKSHITNVSLVGAGGESASMCPISVILRTALLSAATGIILVHNHPSGVLEPSEDDIKVAENLKKACELLGLRFLDSIIVGSDDAFYSFNAGGYQVIKTKLMILENGLPF